MLSGTATCYCKCAFSWHRIRLSGCHSLAGQLWGFYPTSCVVLAFIIPHGIISNYSSSCPLRSLHLILHANWDHGRGNSILSVWGYTIWLYIVLFLRCANLTSRSQCKHSKLDMAWSWISIISLDKNLQCSPFPLPVFDCWQYWNLYCC